MKLQHVSAFEVPLPRSHNAQRHMDIHIYIWYNQYRCNKRQIYVVQVQILKCTQIHIVGQKYDDHDYTLITNLMHWLLFIHKILFSSTCFEHRVLIFILLVGRLKTPYQQPSPTVSSHSSCISTGHQDSYREWRYHMLLVYNYVPLKLSTRCSKHVEENSILWINSNQCIKLVINV